MIVRVDIGAGQVTLEEPDEFAKFHVELRGATVTAEHAWIELDALRRLAGDVDPDWQAGFDGMVVYARDHGFLDEAGATIRAHVVS